MDVFAFQAKLMNYCHLTHASVTSYGRTGKHNHAASGVEHSAHLAWLGADVVYDEPLHRTFREGWARRLGLRVIIEDDHDHLQPLDWEAG